MISRSLLRAGMFVACGTLFACTLNNNTAVPATPSNPPPIVASFTVPAADAGDVGSTHTPAGGGTPYRWDISSIQSQRIGPPGGTYTELVVSVSFENPLTGDPDNSAFAALPGPGQVGAGGVNLDGVIAINTGVPSGTNLSCNAHLLPIDFYVNLAEPELAPTLADDNQAILNVENGFPATQVGEAQVSGGGSVVNVAIPISAIGGSSSGPFNVAVGIFTGFSENDCAPSTGFLSD